MNQRNHQRELDRLLQSLEGRRPSLLLHSCCGVCSSAVLEYLAERFAITLLWYNPNLYPEAEFQKRHATLLELLDKMGLREKVSVLTEPWRHEDYSAAVRGFEDEPEGGARCPHCFSLRLRETARIAAREGFDYFCTTLSLSRHKDAQLLNRLGEEAGAAFGVAWLPSDFKKQGREMRAGELAEQYKLYRQLYCGCEYSLQKREDHGREAADE